MSVIYNLFTNPGQKAKTKLDKTSYVLIMSKRDGKNLRDKTRTKPRHNLDIDIDIDNDIDNILCKHNILRNYVLAEHNPRALRLA